MKDNLNDMVTKQGNDDPLRELALFAGAGGGILGGKLLGWRTICAVERDAHASQVLAQRQNDGILEPFPIWSDVSTFDGKPWRGIVDIVSGGFPCQGISVAGKGNGLEDDRSGLWSEMQRIISEVRPRLVFLENSPAITYRGGVRVIEDLTRLGYDCKWGVIGADACGLDHHRARFWMVANRKEKHGNSWNLLEKGAFKTQGKFRRIPGSKISEDWRKSYQGSISVNIFRDPSDGLAADVDELAELGNGQVPIVAATAFNILNNL